MKKVNDDVQRVVVTIDDESDIEVMEKLFMTPDKKHCI